MAADWLPPLQVFQINFVRVVGALGEQSTSPRRTMSLRIGKRASRAVAAIIAIGNVVMVSSGAQALETYESISASSSPYTQNFANGTTAAVELSNGANYATAYASYPFNAPKLKYQVTGTANSAVKFSFTSTYPGWTGVSDLRLYYGWVNNGDQSVVSTSASPSGLDFTTTGVVVAHDQYANCGDCYGTAALDASGQIKAPNATSGRAYNGVIQLHFDTPITWIQILGPGTRTDLSGTNGFGIDIPVVTNTVTFMANDGGAGTASQTKGVPTALDANTFSNPGFNFAGWATEQGGGGDTYSDGQEYNFASDITLYAQWTPIVVSHTVTFDPNGGSGTFDPQDSSGTAALNINTLTREGFTFAGWNTERDGSGTSYADGAEFDFSGDQTLYAQWTPVPALPGINELGSLVNTGLSTLGPIGTAGVLVAFGSPILLLSERFRRTRAYGAIVLHRSSNLTITSPASFFDRLRKRK